MKIHSLLASAAIGLCTLSALPALAVDSASDFVANTAIANKFEIESSKLALDKSQNDDVKKFAQKMIDDHTAASGGLKSAVEDSQAQIQIPTDLDPKHQKLIDALNNESGVDFDKDYIKDQTKAHKEAVSMFKDYAKSGDNDSLKTFAGKTLPTLKKHLDHVKQLKAS